MHDHPVNIGLLYCCTCNPHFRGAPPSFFQVLLACRAEVGRRLVYHAEASGRRRVRHSDPPPLQFPPFVTPLLRLQIAIKPLQTLACYAVTPFSPLSGERGACYRLQLVPSPCSTISPSFPNRAGPSAAEWQITSDLPPIAS